MEHSELDAVENGCGFGHADGGFVFDDLGGGGGHGVMFDGLLQRLDLGGFATGVLHAPGQAEAAGEEAGDDGEGGEHPPQREDLDHAEPPGVARAPRAWVVSTRRPALPMVSSTTP